MKLTKRIIALTIVLCTLGAMMIPGVSATEPASLQANFVQDFLTSGYPDAETTNTSFRDTLNTDALTNFNNNYATNGWTFYTNAEGSVVTNSPKVTTSKLTDNSDGGFLVNGAKVADTAYYLALKIKAPGTGEYSFKARFDTVSRCTKAGAYILDMPATPYTIDTLPKPDAAFNQPAESKISLQTRYYDTGKVEKGTFNTKDDNITVSLVENQEYILVLWCQTTTEVPTGTPYTVFSFFELNYEGPTQEENTTVYEAAIGDTQYETFAKAVEAANAAEGDVTIEVLTDITTATGAFSLDSNVTLNLNGKVLNAGIRNDVTAKLTDSVDGAGFLCAANTSVLTSSDDEFIMWDVSKDNVTEKNGWRVYDYTLKSEGDVDTSADSVVARKFWATMKFDNAVAYDSAGAGIGMASQFGFELQWTPVEGEASAVKQFMIAGEDMIAWANEQKATEDILSFFINVTGFEKIEEAGTLTVTPLVKRGDSVKTAIYAETMTYTVE